MAKTSNNNSNFKNKLAKLGSAWKNAVEESKKSNFTELPDGRYMARAVAGGISEAKSDGHLQIWIEFIVVQGEQKGEKCRTFRGIDDPDKLVHAARLLRSLGIPDVDELEPTGLDQAIQDLVKDRPCYRIKLNTPNDRQFLDVDKLVECDDDVDTTDEAGAGDAGSNASGDDANNGGGDPVAIEVGDEVTWDDDGTDRIGEVKKIKGENAVVESEGDRYSVELTSLSKPGEGGGEAGAGEAYEPEVGDTVTFDDDGTERTGEIKKIKGDKAIVESEGDQYSVELTALTKADEGAGEQTEEIPTKGGKVSFKAKGKKLVGEVTKVNESARTVDVKVGKEAFKGLSFDAVEIMAG